MRRAAKLSLNLFFLVSLVLAFTLVIDWFDPWALASGGIRAELAQNPNLENDLRFYRDTSQSWRDSLSGAVPAAEVLVGVVDSNWGGFLEQVLSDLADALPVGQVPLEIIKGAVEVIVNAARTLTELDRELAGVVDLSEAVHSLVYLREGSDFSPEILMTLRSHCRDGAADLTAVDNRLVSFAEDIERLEELQASEDILAAFDRGKSSWMPPLNRLAEALYDALYAWLSIDEDLDVIHSRLSQDIRTLKHIDWWITAASVADTVMNVTGVREANVWLKARRPFLLSLATLFLALWLGFLLGDFLAERARWRALTKQKETKIVVVQQSPERSPSPESEPRRRPKQQSSLPTSPPSSQSFARPRLEGSLVLIRPDKARQTFPLPSEGKITVGSGEANEVVIADPDIVEYHLMIRAARTCYFVQPLSDLAGVFINGQVVSGPRRLQHGDTLQIGSCHLTFLQDQPG